MDVCVDRCVTGTDRYLVVSSDPVSVSWSDLPPHGAWTYANDASATGPMSFDELIAEEGVSVDADPPSPRIRAVATAAPTLHRSSVPWGKIMTKAEHRTFLKRIARGILGAMGRVSVEYFSGYRAYAASVFGTLVPARIDQDELERRIENETSDSQLSALRSFRPPVVVPVYTRGSTRTGRMTVMSGPQILTLRKDHRCIVVPTDPSGAVVSMDFSAHEARVAWLETHDSCPPGDLYSYVAEEVLGTPTHRDIVKRSVLAELFGQGTRALAEQLGVGDDAATCIATKIRTAFGTDTLTLRLNRQFLELGHLRSRFGRRIDVPDMRLFLNSYVQATAVDVALCGFRSVMDGLLPTSSRPIYVIHDDLLVDCPAGDVDLALSISAAHVPTYTTPFPLRTKLLCSKVT